MFACIYVPDFPVEALLCLEPELRAKPVAVLEGKPPLARLIAMNDAARDAVLEFGMTRMQAQLRAPEAVLRMRSPEQEASAHASLLDCGHAFSPRVEDTALDHIVFDVSGLDRLLGNLPQIAEQISQRVASLGLRANVAIASNPDAATYAARGFSGITVIPAGSEAERLSTLPVENLSPLPEILETFDRWGVRTFKHLANLPEVSLSQRLGQYGLQLQRLARGAFVRTLVPAEAPLIFQETMELEYAIDLLEPLAFVLSRLLEHICARLEARSLATNTLHLWLQLEDSEHGTTSTFERDLRLPVPMLNPKLFLQLLHLDLKAHPPAAPINKVRLTADPVRPRVAQGGLFLPDAPEAERLELTLARAKGIVGEERIGSAKMLDTHRPDPFRMERFEVAAPTAQKQVTTAAAAHIAKRIFRPPLAIGVHVSDSCPTRLQPQGDVLACSGPWRTSGEWWSEQAWQHEEWDVAVREKEAIVLYRIYRDMTNGRWFLAASYD